MLSVGELIFMLSLANGDQEIMYGPCAGTGFGFLIWLIVAAIIQKETVQAALITDRDITLKKVHEKFEQALKQLRRSEREKTEEDWEEDDDRPRRLPRAESEQKDDRTSFRAERDRNTPLDD